MTTATQDRKLAEQKLRSALNLIEKLIAGDWPYTDSSDALEAIAGEFRAKLSILEGLGPAGNDIVYHWCAEARQVVARYHTFIGVILRSSNIRNAFESYAPIRDFAKILLGDGHKVIVGSEWSYTPFVYPIPVTSLENFIFVGLPASEAQNSLLTPVAGHELGHAVWRRTEVALPIQKKVTEDIIQSAIGSGPGQSDLFPGRLTREEADKDLRLRTSLKRPYDLAMRQCEEVFCDVLACWLFGDSFLHAFRYLTVPDLHPRLSEYYPTNRTRAEVLQKSASTFHGHSFPLQELFKSTSESVPADVKLADEITKSSVDIIIRIVDGFCASKGELKKPTQANTARCEENLRKICPVESLQTPADVLTAAWRIRLDLDNWEVPGVDPNKKIGVLNDLVFKSFEVDEIRKIDAQ